MPLTDQMLYRPVYFFALDTSNALNIQNTIQTLHLARDISDRLLLAALQLQGQNVRGDFLCFQEILLLYTGGHHGHLSCFCRGAKRSRNETS